MIGQFFDEKYLKLYSYVVIPFSFLVLIGILFLAWRRFINRPKALGKISERLVKMANKIGNMKPGIYALQIACKSLVYPIYISSNLAWPKNTFIKKNHEIKVRILKPIKCYYTKNEFLNKLENILKKEHKNTHAK